MKLFEKHDDFRKVIFDVLNIESIGPAVFYSKPMLNKEDKKGELEYTIKCTVKYKPSKSKLYNYLFGQETNFVYLSKSVHGVGRFKFEFWNDMIYTPLYITDINDERIINKIIDGIEQLLMKQYDDILQKLPATKYKLIADEL